jgi:N-acetylmuramoyl-L-alanine amidase
MALTGKKIYAVDPGHGGSDTGATFKDLKESQIVLKIAQSISKMSDLVFFTRLSDIRLSISERVNLVNSQKDLKFLISLHLNSDTNASGTEVYYCNQNPYYQKAMDIGRNLLTSFCTEFNLKNRGLKECLDAGRGFHFGIIRSVNIPAVLIELGFIQMDGYFINNNIEKIAKFLYNFLEKLKI